MFQGNFIGLPNDCTMQKFSLIRGRQSLVPAVSFDCLANAEEKRDISE